MDQKTTEFLSYFNKIENHLQGLTHRRTSFAQMVREVARHNHVIRREEDLLDSLRELRNVLVHEAGNVIIAVPSDEALEAIKRIYKSLVEPKAVYDVIDHQMVTLDVHTDLAKALRVMGRHDYSQVPVYEKKSFAGLLTGNAISRWLHANMDENDDLVKSLNDVKLSEVLVYCEKSDDVVFINRHMKVGNLLDRIAKRPAEPEIYLMTENGKAAEKPLAIVTAEDYMILEDHV